MLCDDAKRLPISEREAKGGYGGYSDPSAEFTETKGEKIARSLQGCLVQQEWIDWDSEPLFEDIISTLAQLDQYTDDPRLWQELFALVKELK